MKDEQKDYLTIEECKEIVKNFESSDDKSSFTKEGFTHFLIFNDWQVKMTSAVSNSSSDTSLVTSSLERAVSMLTSLP